MPPMKVRFVKGKPYTPYEVAVGKKITGTKRDRKYFPTRDQAESYIVRVRQNGYHNADIRTESEPGKLSLMECSAMWRSRQEGKGKSTIRQIGVVTRRLDKTFGNQAIDTISHRELEIWVNDIPGGYVSKLNHWRIARRFFGFAHDWLEAIPRNPMVKVPKPEGTRNEKEILSPRDMVLFLKAALTLPEEEKWPLVLYLGLGAFAGIRMCEILKMEGKDIKKQVYVRHPKVTKRGLRPRYVDILPPLKKILDVVAVSAGKIIPWNDKNFRIHRANLLTAINEKLPKNSQLKTWPDNCLRHSFKTYHIAHFQNIEKTRVQMGHAKDDMTLQYGDAGGKEDAKAWLAIDIKRLMIQ